MEGRKKQRENTKEAFVKKYEQKGNVTRKREKERERETSRPLVSANRVENRRLHIQYVGRHRLYHEIAYILYTKLANLSNCRVDDGSEPHPPYVLPPSYVLHPLSFMELINLYHCS